MLTSFARHDTIPDCDVCVVGAGPVGIALALACERSGMSVLVLESGHEQPDPFAAALTAGHGVDAERHAAAGIAICRGLGGTSRWWGGRCVPLDDIDFAQRPHVPNAAWPIPHQEISRWYEAAASFFGIGPARFTAARASSATFGDVRSDQLERWTPEIDAGRRHRTQLANSRRITVMMGATVTELLLAEDGRRVIGLTLGDTNRTVHIAPRRVVLACGGLETTRLLLRAQQQRPSLFGGRDGPLGRGYMGHASGKIADLVLADPAAATAYDFFVDDGVYARRRFTLKPEAQAAGQTPQHRVLDRQSPLPPIRPSQRSPVARLARARHRADRPTACVGRRSGKPCRAGAAPVGQPFMERDAIAAVDASGDRGYFARAAAVDAAQARFPDQELGRPIRPALPRRTGADPRIPDQALRPQGRARPSLSRHRPAL